MELKTNCQYKSQEILRECDNEKNKLQSQFEEKKISLQKQFDEDMSKLQQDIETEMYITDENASREIKKIEKSLIIERTRIEGEVEKFKLFLIPDLNNFNKDDEESQKTRNDVNNSKLNLESEDEDVNKEFECPVCLEFMAPPKQVI